MYLKLKLFLHYDTFTKLCERFYFAFKPYYNNNVLHGPIVFFSCYYNNCIKEVDFNPQRKCLSVHQVKSSIA